MMAPSAATLAMPQAMEVSSVMSQTTPDPTGQVPLRDSPATRKPRRSSSTGMASPIPRLAPVTMICPSLIAERRLSFCSEGGHALLCVGCAESKRRQIGLYFQPLVNRDIVGSQHGVSCKPKCNETVGRELTGKPDCSLHGIVIDQAVDQPNGHRLFSRYRPAEQDHLERAAFSNDP